MHLKSINYIFANSLIEFVISEHTLDIESILRKFEHWLKSKYTNIKIVEMYVGSRKPTLKRVLVLVIDDNDLIPEHTFEDDGEVFEIVCKLWKFPPSEGDYVFGLKDDIKIPETTLIKLEGCLKEVSKKLFENHSNLEILSVSAHRSRKNGGEVELELCIVLYCSCKGIIPYNEAEFPTQIQGVKTDVREGFFYLFPNDSFFKKASDTLNPLMIGANIGRKGIRFSDALHRSPKFFILIVTSEARQTSFAASKILCNRFTISNNYMTIFVGDLTFPMTKADLS